LTCYKICNFLKSFLDGGVAQVVEHQPSKHKALSSNPNAEKNNPFLFFLLSFFLSFFHSFSLSLSLSFSLSPSFLLSFSLSLSSSLPFLPSFLSSLYSSLLFFSVFLYVTKMGFHEILVPLCKI
jgi:hypothetical protein